MRKFFIIVLSLLLFNSCSYILTNTTTSTITSKTKGAKLSLIRSTDVTGSPFYIGTDSVTYYFRNNIPSHLLKCEKDGYKTQIIPIYPGKINKLKFAGYLIPVVAWMYFSSNAKNLDHIEGGRHALVLSSFFIGIFGAVPPSFSPSKMYEKKYQIPELEKLPVKDSVSNNVKVNKVSLNVNSKDFNWYYYNSFKKYNNNNFTYSNISEKDFVYDNTDLNEDLNLTLQKFGLTDSLTDKKNLNTGNNLRINCVIQKISGHRVMCYANINLQLKWELMDYSLKNILVTKEISSISGWNSYTVNNKSRFREMVVDAIEEGILDFLKDEEVKKVTNDTKYNFNNISEEWNYLAIQNDNKISKNINDAISSVVTIKSKEGHASGCLISSNGYIVTNFHVTGNSNNELEVILGSGKSFKCSVIRENPLYDLALLKIDTINMNYLSFNNKAKYKVGIDVYAIGTPSSVDLKQTLTKGIVSGRRKDNNLTLIQTDCSISPGSSGGALINTDINLIGIVNSKYSGIGVEGIAFAIPAEYIETALKIKFE